MARIPILKKDGTPTEMFWSDVRDSESKPLKRVFRETDDGRVMRSKSIRYNEKQNRLQRV